MSGTTIMALMSIFVRFGLPELLVMDNGPQFISEQLKTNGIRHARVAPYHSSSNGEAEHFVQSFKNAFRAMD